jgi:hypothetical protein
MQAVIPGAKRLCKPLLPMVLFAAIAIAIVALKALIWIPRVTQ